MHQYTGIDITAQEELPIDEWLLYRRDAAIAELNKSEDGRNYLERCWLFEQTEPDRGALRKQFSAKKQKSKPNNEGLLFPAFKVVKT